MTYASHARVITGIIQANLTHLSIKMTTPHQSGAPFVGERVFQNRGVCGQAFPSFPSPTPFLQPFCSRPIFRASRMRKTNTRCPNFVRFVRERLLRRLARESFESAKAFLSFRYGSEVFFQRYCWRFVYLRPKRSSEKHRSYSLVTLQSRNSRT